MQAEKQQIPPFKHSSSRISAWEHPLQWLIKDRFSKENWFGSMISLVLMRSNYMLAKAAMVRKINGEQQTDYTRVLSFAALGFEKIWSFSGGRGGLVPEGKTMLARIKNALRHPNQSSSQFEFLIIMPIRLLQIYGNFNNGLKAYGYHPTYDKESRSFKLGKVADHESAEKIRLWIGGMQIIWQAVALGGFFKKPKEKSEQPEKVEELSGIKAFNKSTSILHQDDVKEKKTVIAICKQLWKHDRQLILGTLLSLTITAMSAYESYLKKDRSKEEAKLILKATMINTAISLSYQYYQFSRIIKDSYMTPSQVADNDQHLPPKVKAGNMR